MMWSKWEDLYEIRREEKEVKRKDGTTYKTSHYFVFNKGTNEKHFTKSRPYGYSDLTSAKCGAAHRFRLVIKTLEKELLGG